MSEKPSLSSMRWTADAAPEATRPCPQGKAGKKTPEITLGSVKNKCSAATSLGLRSQKPLILTNVILRLGTRKPLQTCKRQHDSGDEYNEAVCAHGSKLLEEGSPCQDAEEDEERLIQRHGIRRGTYHQGRVEHIELERRKDSQPREATGEGVPIPIRSICLLAGFNSMETTFKHSCDMAPHEAEPYANSIT